MDIQEMEACGVFYIYSELSSFIARFLEKNHPLTNNDLKALIKGEKTENSIERQKVLSAMREKLDSIVEAEAKRNKKLIDDFKKNPNMSLLNKDFIAEQNEKIKKFTDEILESRWEALNEDEVINKL